MQALGAYGFLGRTSGLDAFLAHIPAGLDNLLRATAHVRRSRAFASSLKCAGACTRQSRSAFLSASPIRCCRGPGDGRGWPAGRGREQTRAKTVVFGIVYRLLPLFSLLSTHFSLTVSAPLFLIPFSHKPSEGGFTKVHVFRGGWEIVNYALFINGPGRKGATTG